MLNQPAPLDLAFHALADPSRRAMVEQLATGPASVSALAEPLSLSLPGVLQHLQVLEASGLVRTVKVGRVRTCQLEPAAMQTVARWVVERRTCAASPSRVHGHRELLDKLPAVAIAKDSWTTQ